MIIPPLVAHITQMTGRENGITPHAIEKNIVLGSLHAHIIQMQEGRTPSHLMHAEEPCVRITT